MTASASAATAAQPLLHVRDLQSWYGESHVVHGVSFNVAQGEVVTLIGRNGAGKTTILRSIIGILKKRTGSIIHNGIELISMPSRLIARRGIGYVPEERGIFTSLTVQENLELLPNFKQGGMTNQQIFDLFPNLKERLGSQGTKLSGGEQQMLAISRILRSGADFLLLDEPTEGLAPVIIQQIWQTILKLKELGLTIVLVEQNIKFTSTLTDRYYVIEEGHLVDEMTQADAGKLHAYLGV